jgi:hypothetical protein
MALGRLIPLPQFGPLATDFVSEFGKLRGDASDFLAALAKLRVFLNDVSLDRVDCVPRVPGLLTIGHDLGLNPAQFLHVLEELTPAVGHGRLAVQWLSRSLFEAFMPGEQFERQRLEFVEDVAEEIRELVMRGSELLERSVGGLQIRWMFC